MTQPTLFDSRRAELRPRKRVRQVSRTLVRVMRESGQLAKSQAAFLDLVRTHNDIHEPSTLAELAVWGHQHGWLPRPDPNLIRPRATELCVGKRRKGRLVKAGGLIEFMKSRKCRITGRMAHPIRLASP